MDKKKQKSASNGISKKKPISAEDFYAYAPQNKFIYIPTGELWPKASVDARFNSNKEIRLSDWLSKNRSIEQMTWAPGESKIIKDKVITNGGWQSKPGVHVFNHYKAPSTAPGCSSKATPWIDHIQLVYPDDSDHLISWFAHRVQFPGVKVNHAIVLGGSQGIGKDTILEPVRMAIGPWNFHDITPLQLMGRFNGFIKSVILRISEARDLGHSDRYSMYEQLKTYIAAPPMVLMCDEKNTKEYGVLNLCGVVITTNYKTGGIYLPADDRRHYVAWSYLNRDQFEDDYWEKLWGWYEDGGYEHVATYLKEYDLSHFDPKAPPTKTNAFWDIVDSDRAIEDARMADALDRLKNPVVVTIEMISNASEEDFRDWMNDSRNRRQIPNRFEEAGYVKVRNPDAKDGMWKILGKRVVVYGQKKLSEQSRISAARQLISNNMLPPIK